LVFSPIAAQQFDFRRSARVVFRAKYDCDHVITVGFPDQTEHAPVGARGAGDLSLLATIHIYLRRRKPIGSAALHFNETQRLSMISDKVEFDVDGNSESIASNRQDKVCGDDVIATLLQVRRG